MQFGYGGGKSLESTVADWMANTKTWHKHDATNCRNVFHDKDDGSKLALAVADDGRSVEVTAKATNIQKARVYVNGLYQRDLAKGESATVAITDDMIANAVGDVVLVQVDGFSSTDWGNNNFLARNYVMIEVTPPPVVGANEFLPTGTGEDWGADANWSHGTCPNSAGAEAFIGAPESVSKKGVRNVKLDTGDVTVGSLTFENGGLTNRLTGAGNMTFNGALKADMQIEYGIKMEEVRYRYDAENNNLTLANFHPGIISYSKKQLKWEFARTFKSRSLLGHDLPPFSDTEADKFTQRMCEQLRNELESEIDKRQVTEFEWLKPLVTEQVVDVLKLMVGKENINITIAEGNGDESFLEFKELKQLQS